MKIYIQRKNGKINATAEYNPETKECVVLKGSIVSEGIAYSKTFRGAKSVEKMRGDGVVVDCIVTKNVSFKSPSTAANFVTGASTNGMTAWKDKSGKTLKEILEEA